MPRLPLLASVLLLAVAPATALGQDASDEREMRRLLARPSRLLFGEELRGNCAGLTVTIKTHIDRLRELQKRAQQEGDGPPATMLGERPGVAEFTKERDRVEALNVVLDAKGCMPVNVEEELKKSPPAPPTGKNKHPARTSSSSRRSPAGVGMQA
jgi:hypothetical protein